MGEVEQKAELEQQRKALEARKLAFAELQKGQKEGNQAASLAKEAEARLRVAEELKHRADPSLPLRPDMAASPPPAAVSGPDEPVRFAPDQIRAVPKPNRPNAGVMSGYDPLADTAPQQFKTPPGLQPRPAPAAGPAGPPGPPPLAGGETPPSVIDLPMPGAGGGGGVMVPGGMHPESQGVTHQAGHVAPVEAQAAYAGETGAELEGARLQNAADKELAEHTAHAATVKMAAVDAAAAQHQQVQIERQAEVQQRLSQIENLNAEASAKIDPNKFWTDRGAGAKILGAIAMGLGAFASSQTGGRNMAAETINAGINREIDAQIANQKNAHTNAQNATSLLKLHMDAWGDRDKAIDATKLALFDNVLQQMEQYKASHAGQVSDANYQNTLGAILGKRGDLVTKLNAKAEGETTNEYHEKYAAPHMVGGAGVGANNKLLDELFKQGAPTDTVVIPPSDVLERTRQAKPGEEKRISVGNTATATRLNQTGGAVGALMFINKRASDLLGQRQKLNPVTDYNAYQLIDQELAQLADDKASIGSVKNAQGVLREPEYVRANAIVVGFNYNQYAPWNGGPGSTARVQRVQELLRRQNEQMYRQFNADVAAQGGSEVRHQFVRDPRTGLERKIQREVGRAYDPSAVAPAHDSEVK